MAPFRASRSTRSGRPGGPSDHDIFDGLPVRQWKLQDSFLGPNDEINGDAAKAAAAQNEKPELPMPKGSEHYAPWSLQLLRAARSGRVLKSNEGGAVRAGKGPEDNGTEDTRAEEVQQRGTKRGVHNGFVATKWSQTPKHLEGPEREYLAKRRKGLQSTQPNKNGVAAAPIDTTHMRKTKVRRPDESGLPQVLEVMVPEGQTVEGEIREEVTLENAAAPIATPAPGTVVQGLGIANEDGVVVATEGVMPIKKRGPIRKKKKKKGGINISTTGGQGVSASAEAFLEQQRQARLAAESGDHGDKGTDSDSVMTGTNGEDDDDEEEGSEEEDEGEVQENENDNSTLQPSGVDAGIPDALGEVPEITTKLEETPTDHSTAEVPQPFLTEPQEQVSAEPLAQGDQDVTMDVGEHGELAPAAKVEDEDMEGVTGYGVEDAPEERQAKAPEVEEARSAEEFAHTNAEEVVKDADETADQHDQGREAQTYVQPQPDPEPISQGEPQPPTATASRPDPVPDAEEEEPSNAAAGLAAESIDEASPAVVDLLAQTNEAQATESQTTEAQVAEEHAAQEQPSETQKVERGDDDTSDSPARPSPEPLSPYSPTRPAAAMQQIGTQAMTRSMEQIMEPVAAVSNPTAAATVPVDSDASLPHGRPADEVDAPIAGTSVTEIPPSGDEPGSIADGAKQEANYGEGQDLRHDIEGNISTPAVAVEPQAPQAAAMESTKDIAHPVDEEALGGGDADLPPPNASSEDRAPEAEQKKEPQLQQQEES